MRNLKFAFWILIAILAGLCLVMLVFSGEIYALMGLLYLPFVLAAPSAPFCLLQLALCKYCKGRLLPKLPLLLSLLGLVGSLCFIIESSNIEALAGLLVLFPSLLGLVGSGLGWFIWHLAEKRCCGRRKYRG